MSKIYKTIILPIISYGCETCSLSFLREHRLRTTMLRKILESKREVVSSWGEIHNGAILLHVKQAQWGGPGIALSVLNLRAR